MGVAYMGAVLKKQGADVEVYCQDVFHYSNQELASHLEKNTYDLIGVGFLAARFNETVIDLCSTINQSKKDAWLVSEGHGPSPIPEYMLKKTGADVVVIGEAEESIGEYGRYRRIAQNNIKFIKEYNSYDQLRTIRPPTPYPGCDLYYEAIKRGLLSGPEDFFNKFNNSDLLLVNFTDIPEKEFYRMLFEANKELILDHYSHTTKEMDKAHTLIQDFYDLYFGNKTKFRGARHYNAA